MADDSEREWNPVEGRRTFLAAAGTAGTASVAGCLFFGDGGDGGGGPAPGPSDSEEVTVDPETNDQIPEERANFAVPADGIETTFDASFDDSATVVDSERMSAVVDADADSHEYTIDEDELGGEVSEGDVLMLSGVALRKVTTVDRSGSEATVQTEQATLDEAISDGTVGWDSEVGLDTAFSPDSENRETIDESANIEPVGMGGGGAVPPDGEMAYLTGIEMVGGEGVTPVPPSQIEAGEGTLEWTFVDADREYTIRAELVDEEEATIGIQVKQPAGGDANLAMTARGTIGSMRSVAAAEYTDNELRSFELEQNNVAADIDLEIAAAGSKDGSIDWEFPGIMFKYVIFAGPVPVTLSFNTKLIGNITVPSVEGSATGSATFNYRADTGFSYGGSDVNVEASVGDQPLQPDEADSAANIGQPVDLQFGAAFPRLEISVFDQVLIPYLEFGMTIGSRLTWGPLCKSSYVRMVINAGYDFEIMGVTLSSDEETLLEETERASGDSCENE